MSLILKLSILAVVTFGIASDSLAFQRPKQDPPPKVGPVRPLPAKDELQEPEPTPVLPLTEEAFTRVMADLSEQIVNLTTELRMLRKEAERNSTTMELMLNEERLLKLEAKLDDMTELKYQLDGREADLLRRLRNIQQEIILRGGTILRREEAEAAVRGELNRALESTRAQRESTEHRVTELTSQAEGLRRRIETLKKRLEPEIKPESSDN